MFTVGGADWGARAEAAVRDVSRAVGTFVSPVVHGHVGYLGGLLAARLAEPGAKVFATEHSTALRDVLAQPAAREHYAELIERADAVFCVSNLLRRQILDAVPDPGAWCGCWPTRSTSRGRRAGRACRIGCAAGCSSAGCTSARA
ncbi:MAG: glycosyltransferase [Kineosporiaceae bacterium]